MEARNMVKKISARCSTSIYCSSFSTAVRLGDVARTTTAMADGLLSARSRCAAHTQPPRVLVDRDPGCRWKSALLWRPDRIQR
jgi:hypothetical protein